MAEPFIHPTALCETSTVGDGTRIWAFAHVLAGARIGKDCNICDGVFIEGDVSVGHRVTVKCGVQLWNGITLHDDVFVGPNATFTNDRFPRSRRWLAEPQRTIVHEHASIGAGSVILSGLEIGRGAMVGAGAVVTRSVPPNALVTGNPARIVGYTDSPRTSIPAEAARLPVKTELDVSGVYVITFREHSDLRGHLTAAEMPGSEIPFVPRRWFLVYDVPTREVRGEHAHRTCQQFLVCVAGSVAVAVDDGRQRGEIVLSDPTLGVYVPPLVWASQYRYDPDSVLLVLASDPYDPADYIRDYDEFLAVAGGHAGSPR